MNFYKTSLFLIIGFLGVFVLFGIAVAQEIDKERAIDIVSQEGGPGGCIDEESCRNFCDNPDNFEVCINWARENGMMSEDEAERAKEFAEEGRQFSGPGGCVSPEQCEEFCREPQNHDTCMDFAVERGFLTQEEADRIREFRKEAESFGERAAEEKFEEEIEVDPEFDKDQALKIIETEGGPGGCRTFDECESFCEEEENQESCFEFAEKHRLFKDERKAEKIKKIMKEGGPGGCRGEKECRNFCDNPDNFEVCMEFAKKHEFMKPEQIEKAEKGIRALKEGGPNNCRTPKECKEVCMDQANQELCFEWAKKYDLMDKEEIMRIEEFKRKGEEMRRGFEQRFEKEKERFRMQEEFRLPEGSVPHGEFSEPVRNMPVFTPPADFKPDFEQIKMCIENGGFWNGTACEIMDREEDTPQSTPEYMPEFTPEFAPEYVPKYSPAPFYEQKQIEPYQEQPPSIIEQTGAYMLNSFKEFFR